MNELLFSASTPLMEVMRDPSARAVVDRYIPSLSTSSVLHTLFGYPLGLVTATDPHLRRHPEMRNALLAEIATVPLPPSTPISRQRSHPAFAENYESPAAPTGCAHVSVPASGVVNERIEIALDGPAHGNPYIDVNLMAAVEGPAGSFHVVGFYDGDGRYRLRWLPEAAGEYAFVTASNAASLDGVTGTVKVVNELAPSRGPVRVSGDFHFAYNDGAPYLPIGTTAYAWIHQSESLQDETIGQLAVSSFNKVRMCVFPKSYLFNENEPQLFPYVRRDDGRFDFTSFHPAFWLNLERRIDQLRTLGIEADLILFHAYDRWGFSTMTADQDDLFVRYAVSRLSSFANVWWSLANEYDLLFDKTPEDWEEFARIVQQTDPTGHLISIHNCRTLYDHGRPWVTHVSIQRQDVYKTAEMITEWRTTWAKPVVLDEAAYEGNIDQGWGNITGEEMVRRFWEGAVRGGYVGHGETYVDNQDVLWWSKGGRLHGTSPDRIAFLRDIIQEAPGGHLEPVLMDWDVPSAGVADQYYLYYFGFYQPSFRRFLFDPTLSFKADVIDTWNMTIETLPGVHCGRFTIRLPSRQYMAIRLRAVDATDDTTSRSHHDRNH